MTTPGSEIVVYTDEQVVGALVDGKELAEIESADDAAKAILGSILAADDVDAILATFESTPWRDLLGVPVRVHGVKFRPSAFKGEGPPIFTVIEATNLQTDDRLTLTNGGRSVMAALYRMAQLDAFPQDLELHESAKPNEDGNRALLIRRARKVASVPEPEEATA